MDQNESRLVYTCYMLTFFLCGALLFLFGFFPASYMVAENEKTVPAMRPTTLHNVNLEPPPASYDAFVLLLIDALRKDFVNATTMPVAFSKACEKLTLHVDIPTVTMPRLKSITTGTLSNFIDIALNIGHAEQLNDSLLHRLKEHNVTVSFAGDHTWLQLFPSEFKRHVGNNDSFFVNDFSEGDKNVTKVLDAELQMNDWTLLILHYLGLDHIGHVEGDESPRINIKLREMDEVLQKILDRKSSTNSLVMLTGDHGMANGGGHGGNTREETLVPLYLYSKNCSQSTDSSKRYNQIDLTPTLAVLLSIEIPKMSIGCLIPEMLQHLSVEHQLYAYFYNAYHLLNRARIKFGSNTVKRSDYYTWYKNATLMHKNLLRPLREIGITSNVYYQNAKLNYMRVAHEISALLSESLVKFDYGIIFIGLSLAVATALHVILTMMFMDKTEILQLDSLKGRQMLVSLVASILINMSGRWLDLTLASSVLLVLPIAVLVYLSTDVVHTIFKVALPPAYSRRLKLSIPLPYPLLACFAIRTISLGSSSFIEFEYKTWYYLGNTLLIYISLKTLRRRITKANVELDGRHFYKIASVCLWQQRKIIVVLILLVFMRYLYHFNGIKSTTMIFALMILWTRLHKFNNLLQRVISGFALFLVYCFRGLSGQVEFFEVPPYYATRLVLPVLVIFWCCVAVVLTLGYATAFPYNRSNKNDIVTRPKGTLIVLLQTNLCCSFLVAALLHKAQNVVLLPTLLITLDESYNLCDAYCTSAHKFSVRKVYVFKIIMTIFIARMFYFYQGNSNSLSTIDLTPGYIGQTSYNPVVVGIFVTLNTFCAEIHSFLYLIVYTLRANLKEVGIIHLQPPYAVAIDSLVMPLYAALIMLPAAFYLCLMIGFRYHLFIYSVFSPKVLYDCYTVLVFYLVFLITTLYFKLFKKCA